ncbi:MAG: response regulator transcription factor [Acidimicrobiales bacterium]
MPVSTSRFRSTPDEAALRVLVVEDDLAMMTALTAGLSARGYAVDAVPTGTAALEAIGARAPAAVLLDLGLPDVDGVEICRRIRAWSDVPILVLSADGAEDRKVTALECGADDYVTKPFSMRELHARIGVALRHHRREPAGPVGAFVVGDVIVDVDHHWVTVAGERVDLTPREFDFLAVLARHPGRVLTHGTILAEVWGPEGKDHVEYLRVYARALRRKLGEDPARPRLVTEAGVGYRLVDLSSAPQV